MTQVTKKGKLLEAGGYRGLENAVGKTFKFTKYLGHWNLDRHALVEAGAHPLLDEYAFLQREIKFEWHP